MRLYQPAAHFTGPVTVSLDESGSHPEVRLHLGPIPSHDLIPESLAELDGLIRACCEAKELYGAAIGRWERRNAQTDLPKRAGAGVSMAEYRADVEEPGRPYVDDFGFAQTEEPADPFAGDSASQAAVVEYVTQRFAAAEAGDVAGLTVPGSPAHSASLGTPATVCNDELEGIAGALFWCELEAGHDGEHCEGRTTWQHLTPADDEPAPLDDAREQALKRFNEATDAQDAAERAGQAGAQ